VDAKIYDLAGKWRTGGVYVKQNAANLTADKLTTLCTSYELVAFSVTLTDLYRQIS